jgi:hypothetical protein
MPPPGTDTGLDGKYDPQNGIAQLIHDKTGESAVSKIFEDEHVLVFMPLPQEEVVAPGHVLVVPKRMGARNILDLKPDELRDLMVAVQKAGIAQRKRFGKGSELTIDTPKRYKPGRSFWDGSADRGGAVLSSLILSDSKPAVV